MIRMLLRYQIGFQKHLSWLMSNRRNCKFQQMEYCWKQCQRELVTESDTLQYSVWSHTAAWQGCAAISWCWCLAPVMGNDGKVENRGSRRGYSWQACLLAHTQESAWGTSCGKQSLVSVRKSAFLHCWFMCRLATFALGHGGGLEIGTTSLVWFLPTGKETWSEFWCLWGRSDHNAQQVPAPSSLLQINALAAKSSKAYLSSALSLNFF